MAITDHYKELDILIIILVIFSAILFLHVWLRYKANNKLQKSEEKYRLLVTEISELRRIEKQAFNEKERFKTTLVSVGDGVISTDQQGNVELLNKVAEQLTGWTQEEASGKKFEVVFSTIDEFAREKGENLVQTILDSGQPFVQANHRILIAKDGIERPIEEIASPIKDEEGNANGVGLVFRDYTEAKERQNNIEYLSYRDQLTGLYNRRFYDCLLYTSPSPRD